MESIVHIICIIGVVSTGVWLAIRSAKKDWEKIYGA